MHKRNELVIIVSFLLFSLSACFTSQAEERHFNRSPGVSAPAMHMSRPMGIPSGMQHPHGAMMHTNMPTHAGFPRTVTPFHQNITPVNQSRFVTPNVSRARTVLPPGTHTVLPSSGVVGGRHAVQNMYHRHDHHFIVTPVIPYYFYSYPYPYSYPSYPDNTGEDNSYINNNVYENNDQNSYTNTTITTAVPTDETSDSNATSGYDASAVDQNVIHEGNWVWEQDGAIPDNAIVYGYVNESNAPVYYCKVQFNEIDHVGMLIANDACYVSDNGTTFRYTKYQALVPFSQ